MSDRFVRFLFGLAFVCALALVAVLTWEVRRMRVELQIAEIRSKEPYPGYVVPPVTVASLDGDSVTLGTTGHHKKQVLLFFTTRCGYCQETLEEWERLTTLVQGGRLAEVYGVSLDPDSLTRPFIAEHSVSFPVVRFPDQRYVFIFRAEHIPLTTVVDSSGAITFVHAGSLARRPAVVDSVLRALREPTAPLAAPALD